jgi:hypothetical protein
VLIRSCALLENKSSSFAHLRARRATISCLPFTIRSGSSSANPAYRRGRLFQHCGYSSHLRREAFWTAVSRVNGGSGGPVVIAHPLGSSFERFQLRWILRAGGMPNKRLAKEQTCSTRDKRWTKLDRKAKLPIPCKRLKEWRARPDSNPRPLP